MGEFGNLARHNFACERKGRRIDMAEGKIDINIGQVHFSSQGDQDWVGKQLDKIIAQAEKLAKLAPVPSEDTHEDGEHKPMKPSSAIAKKTLPAFLAEKGATKNQVRKFLATAVWLEAKGQARLTTAEVSSALKSANQTKLGNPSDCLNQNVSKGHCEKDGKQFFVTEDGKTSL
jgi:hypothetical protein